jgi:hypothetical protein
MTSVRVEGSTISLDGYGAGPNQDIRNPLGVGGTDLHQWLVPTRTFQRTLFGADGGTTGIDDDSSGRTYSGTETRLWDYLWPTMIWLHALAEPTARRCARIGN